MQHSTDEKDVIYHEGDVEASKNVRVADQSADYVDASIVITPEENKRLRMMVHKRVLPWMCLAYLMQAMDKNTLALASIMGWQKDVGAVGQDYALTSTFLWIGIIVGEPLVNQFVRRLPVAKVLGYCMLVWSALVVGLGFCLNVPGVFALRFLLGLFESCFGPCLLAITVQWYLKEEQPWVQAIWFSMFGFSNMISSLMAYGFYYIQKGSTGVNGWQWLTLAIALKSFIASGFVIRFLPDSPTTVKWASEEDKRKLVERVRSNAQGIKNTEFKRHQMIEALTDPYCWAIFCLMLFQTLVVGGVNTFNNLLINQGFGFDVLTSQLLGIPLAVDTMLLYMLIAWLVTKTGQTIYCIIGYVIVNIIGTVVLITVAPNSTTRPGLIVAFYAMQCFQACSPSLFSLLSRNSAGQTKKSISYAMAFMGWAGGNAIAPQLFQSKWAPRYLHSLYIHLGLYGVFVITILGTRMLLVRRNKVKEANQEVNTNSHAFDDLTDRENPDFRYSL